MGRTAQALFTAVVLVFTLGVVAPAQAGVPLVTDKLDVTITTVDDAPLIGTGTFAVTGDAAVHLCASGTFASGDARIWWQTDESFKIQLDRTFTCEGTGQSFVLELSGTIVINVGNIKPAWKLKDSSGFDPAPKGKGDMQVGDFGETYVGILTFK